YPVLAPGIGLLVFLLFQLPNIVTPGTAALVPTLGHLLQLGLYENPVFVGYRLLTMLVLVVVFLGLAGMLASGARWADVLRWRVGLLTLLALVLVILPLANPPRTVLAETTPDRACQRVRTVRVCLHQGHRDQLDTVVSVVDSLVA